MTEPANPVFWARQRARGVTPEEMASSPGNGLADGTSYGQILYWDGAAWALLDFADTDYKVLQRKVDDTIGYDFIRAHA